MQVSLFCKLKDMWIGAYWDARGRSLYVCPIPMFGIRLCFCKHERMLFVRNVEKGDELYLAARSIFHCPSCGEVFTTKELMSSTSGLNKHELNMLPEIARHSAYVIIALLQSVDWEDLRPEQVKELRELTARLKSEIPGQSSVLSNNVDAIPKSWDVK